MSDAYACSSIYGPAAELVHNGATAPVSVYASPYSQAVRPSSSTYESSTAAGPPAQASVLSPKDFPRDRSGRFMPR